MKPNPVAMREHTNMWLKAHNVPLHRSLPNIEILGLKSAEEIARKIVDLYCLVGIANGADGQMLLEWLESEGESATVGDGVVDLLLRGAKSEEERNELSWMQESLYTLCWCVGVIEEMAFPDRECDLTGAFASLPPERSIGKFVKGSKLRDRVDVYQEMDKYYALHAALVHPELWADAGMIARSPLEVVLERRHALEWVCDSRAGWDDVTLDT